VEVEQSRSLLEQTSKRLLPFKHEAAALSRISATAQRLFSFHFFAGVHGWLDSKPAPSLEKGAGAQEKNLWCERMGAASFTIFVKGAGFDFPG
jgi:hypothetical protein